MEGVMRIWRGEGIKRREGRGQVTRTHPPGTPTRSLRKQVMIWVAQEVMRRSVIARGHPKLRAFCHNGGSKSYSEIRNLLHPTCQGGREGGRARKERERE